MTWSLATPSGVGPGSCRARVGSCSGNALQRRSGVNGLRPSIAEQGGQVSKSRARKVERFWELGRRRCGKSNCLALRSRADRCVRMLMHRASMRDALRKIASRLQGVLSDTPELVAGNVPDSLLATAWYSPSAAKQTRGLPVFACTKRGRDRDGLLSIVVNSSDDVPDRPGLASGADAQRPAWRRDFGRIGGAFRCAQRGTRACAQAVARDSLGDNVGCIRASDHDLSRNEPEPLPGCTHGNQHADRRDFGDLPESRLAASLGHIGYTVLTLLRDRTHVCALAFRSLHTKAIEGGWAALGVCRGALADADQASPIRPNFTKKPGFPPFFVIGGAL